VYIKPKLRHLNPSKLMKMPMKKAASSAMTSQLFLIVLTCCATLLNEQAASAGPSVVGLWRFNEASGTNILDSSGLGNNGALAGENGKLPTRVAGKSGFGNALRFISDGTNHTYAAIPGSASLMIGQTPTNAWSITVWAYEDSNGTGDFVSTYGRMVVIDDGTAQQLESGASGDDEFYTWARITGAWQLPWGIGSAVAPLLDQWEHVAVVYDGTNETFYLNGNEGPNGGVESQAVTAALDYVGYQGSFLIGSELDQLANHNWNGMLDDVAVFAGALTQAQVQTVMSGDFSAFIGGPVGIVSQPQSLVLAPGSTATFTVGADGAAPFTYQWFFNGTSLGAGATGSSLTLTNVGLSQAGIYSVVVSNSGSGVTSQPATLSINPSLVGLWRFDEGIGTTVSDSSGLGNNGTLQGDNGNLPTWTTGQTGFSNALAFNNDGVNHTYVSIPASPSLMIGQTATNSWTITAWAYENSDGSGDFVSDYGRIMVIDDGFAFQLESGASGDGELYTWTEDGDNVAWQIPWGVGSSVTPLLDQWEHWAVVYDGTNFSVYLNGNEAANNGGFASELITSALGFVGYQGSIIIGSELDQAANCNWNGMLDDVAMFAGALTQAQIQTVMSGDFSGFMGGPPGIVSQPQSLLVVPGSTATFSVGADGSQTLTYQWYFNGTSLGIAGTNATLTLNNVQSSKAGTYSVVVRNATGSVTSQPAVLSVGNLVALWRFNEGSGMTAYDSSGNGNNGTLMGENGNVPVWASGKAGLGGALRFNNDGVDHSYVSVPGNGLLEIGQTAATPWTITAWAYEDSDGTGNFVANYGRIMVIDNGTALQLESGASGDAEFYTWDRFTGLWEIPWGTGNSVSPLLDQWEHWAAVYDGIGTITLYRDGNQGANGGVASAPVTSYVEYGSPDQGAITIGSELAQTGDRNWNGLLDDVAVFNMALSQAQIQTVMAGDFSAFVAQPQLFVRSSPGNVVLSWPAAQATFQLQSAATLAPASWTNVTNSPVSNGGMRVVTLPDAGGTRFFRLIGP
jgi:hypothetical protein